MSKSTRQHGVNRKVHRADLALSPSTCAAIVAVVIVIAIIVAGVLV